MHNVSHLTYYSEVLAFIVFGHFFVFWIIRKDVNTVFIPLKALYKDGWQMKQEFLSPCVTTDILVVPGVR